jgi:hypothetical protein
MPYKGKIIDTELDRYLRQGKSTNEIAKIFNCSPGAVSQRKKKLKQGIVRTMALDKANEVVENHLDMMTQLRKINDAINEELDRAKKEIGKPNAQNKRAIQAIIVKLSGEVRKQLSLQLSIAQVWHDMKIFSEFQQEVLRILDEVEPGTRDEIIRRLKQRNALRRSVRVN